MLTITKRSTAAMILKMLPTSLANTIREYCQNVSNEEPDDEPYKPDNCMTAIITEIDYAECFGRDGNWFELMAEFNQFGFAFNEDDYAVILQTMMQLGWNKQLQTF